MVTLVTLRPRLRRLRLSGLLDAIAARSEARATRLDPLDFLLLLIDDELARREAEAVARRINRARFEDVCDLRDFDFSSPHLAQVGDAPWTPRRRTEVTQQ
jgi:IstB-like ATP binding protein